MSIESPPKSAAPAFRPTYCNLDKKVLRFFAYFVENVVVGQNPGMQNPGSENPGMGVEEEEEDVLRRVRHVHILYFLEDDTISVTEPKIKASTASLGEKVFLLTKRSFGTGNN